MSSWDVFFTMIPACAAHSWHVVDTQCSLSECVVKEAMGGIFFQVVGMGSPHHCCQTYLSSTEASPGQHPGFTSLCAYFPRECCVFLHPLPQYPIAYCLPSRRDSGPASRSTIQGSIVCMCSKDGNDYHRRCKQDYVRPSFQSCPFSKPSCFVLQNHILFCSSSGAVWCWSWICERLGSKSAMFTNTGGMSARYGQIQI